MAQQWFKFWGGEWLNDQKRLALTPAEQNCWVILMCYASQADPGGIVRHLTEERLMFQSGIGIQDDAWPETVGILEKLVNLEMITIDNGVITLNNWVKRQEKVLTPYERVKRYRAKKNDNDDNEDDNARVEKSRVEKNRREEKPTSSINYLSEIPAEDLKELTEKYEASSLQVKRKAEELVNYCAAKGKTYKNYRAFLENALNKDFGRRVMLQPKAEEVEAPLDAEAQARVDALKKEIGTLARRMSVNQAQSTADRQAS